MFLSERTPPFTFLPAGVLKREDAPFHLPARWNAYVVAGAQAAIVDHEALYSEGGGNSKRSGNTVSVLFCLAYSTEHHVLKVHPYCTKYQNFFPFKKKYLFRDFPGSPVAKTVLSLQGAWV